MDFHPEQGLALNTEKLYFQPAKRLEWYSQREEWIIINKIQKICIYSQREGFKSEYH